ncbi:MAG: hypothetical protein Q4G69_04070 [Planctomycetia bacterium]|nr:hypothetical protein [Planctomycetia bacterium]
MSAKKNLDGDSEKLECEGPALDKDEVLQNIFESIGKTAKHHAIRFVGNSEKLLQMEEEIKEGKTESLEPFVELSIDMATMLNRKGFYQQALVHVKKGIAACEKLVEENNRLGILRYPMILYLHADILHALKKGELPAAYIKAETAYDTLLARKLSIEMSDYVNCQRDYAECLLDHAIYLYERHRSDIEAVALLHKAKEYLPLFEDASREERTGFLVSLYTNLARCLLRIGDESGVCLACNELAESLHKEKRLSLAIKEGMIRSLDMIASIKHKQGILEEAIQYYLECNAYHKEHRLRPRKDNREDLFSLLRIEEIMRRIQLSLIDAYIQNEEYQKALEKIHLIQWKWDIHNDNSFPLAEISGFENSDLFGSLSVRVNSWGACCYRHLGQPEFALQMINTALAEGLKNPSSREIIGLIRQEQAEIYLQLGDPKNAALSLEIAYNDFIGNPENLKELKEEKVLHALQILQIIAENAECLGKSPEQEFNRAINFGTAYLEKGMVSLRYPLACIWMKYSDVFKQSGDKEREKEACLNALRLLMILHSEVQDALISEPRKMKENLHNLLDRIIPLVPEKGRDRYEKIKEKL